MRRYEILVLLKKSALENINVAISNELSLIKHHKQFKTIFYGYEQVSGRREKVFQVVSEASISEIAYPIKHETKGVYVLFTFEAESVDLVEFNRLMNLNNNVLRHLVINTDAIYGANALKNPKKAKTSEIIQGKYNAARDAFLNAKNGASLNDIKAASKVNVDLEEDTENTYVAPTMADEEAEEGAVVKKRRSSKK
jgi:ribosomal protein S6